MAATKPMTTAQAMKRYAMRIGMPNTRALRSNSDISGGMNSGSPSIATAIRRSPGDELHDVAGEDGEDGEDGGDPGGRMSRVLRFRTFRPWTRREASYVRALRQERADGCTDHPRRPVR